MRRSQHSPNATKANVDRKPYSEENVVTTSDQGEPPKQTGPRPKVKSTDDPAMFDPERGRGGDFVINDDGIRTRRPVAHLETETDEDE